MKWPTFPLVWHEMTDTSKCSPKRSRRQARELGLKALFFLDTHGDVKNNTRFTDFCGQYSMGMESQDYSFFVTLVQGVMDHLEKIDDLISRHSRNWKLSRMSFVDRNILRLAVFEFMYCPDIPWAVSINEAVDLGKIYGTRGSGAFINGILDGIRMRIENQGNPGQNN